MPGSANRAMKTRFAGDIFLGGHTIAMFPETFTVIHASVGYGRFIREFAKALILPGCTGGAPAHRAAPAIVLVTKLYTLFSGGAGSFGRIRGTIGFNYH